MNPIPPKLARMRNDAMMRAVVMIVGTLALLYLFTHDASAAPGASHRGCSSMSIMGTLAADRWSAQIDLAPTTGNTCVITGSADSAVTDFAASTASGWRILCSHTDGGATGPQAATTAEARIYWDNAAFGVPTVSSGAGFIRTISLLTNCPDGASQSNQFITTVYCTDTGLVSGSPRYGNQRIMVHVASTGGVAPYDVNSDTQADVQGVAAAIGIVRCVPDVTAANVTSTGGAFHHYVGGDTLRSSITASASDPFTAAANQVTPAADCGSTNNFAAIDLAVASAVTADLRIIGATNTWVDDCALTVKWTHTNTSSISVYSGVPYGKWNTSAIPASTSLDATKTVLTFDPTDDVDRTLYPTGACTVTINGASAGTMANRKDAVLINSCSPWQDKRANNVPNNQAARGWYQFTNTYRDTTNFASSDGLFGASGQFTFTLQSTTTAATCATMCYHKAVEDFDTTARTDAVLLNWGNSSDAFGMSSTFVAANITNNKPPTHTNATSFLIGNDQEEQFVYFLHNQALQAVQSVNVTCFRTKPSTVTESSVAFGPTDSAGNTSATTVTYSVDSPSGTWTTTCSGSMNGNTFTYVISYFHSRSFTADITINVHWNVTRQANASYFANVTVLLAEYDPTLDGMAAIFPDAGTAPKLNVSAYDASVGRYTNTLILRQVMRNTDGPTSSSYYWNFYTSASNLCDVVALVNTNLTGSPFAGSEGYHLNNTACGAVALPPASCGTASSDPCFNFYAQNVTSANATVGNVTANNGTFTNLTFTEADGVIETSIDPFVPIVFWGGLLMLFLWRDMYFTSVAAFVCLAANLPAAPIISLAGCVMLLTLTMITEIMLTWWLPDWYARLTGRPTRREREHSA